MSKDTPIKSAAKEWTIDYNTLYCPNESYKKKLEAAYNWVPKKEDNQ